MVFEVVLHFLVERVTVVAPVNVGAGIKIIVLAVAVEVIVYIVRKVGECLVSSAGGGGRVFGDKYLKGGVGREVVVSVDSESFHKLKSVGVCENVISSRSRAVWVHKACGFAVLSSPLVGVSSNIKPCFVVKLFGQCLYFVRIGIQITEDEGRPVRVLCFFMEYRLDYSVGFLGDLVFCEPPA